jgi:predicted alpha/beta-fold hydrolase
LGTEDGDFVDLVRLDAPAGSPRIVVLHGLEGTEKSHYVRGLFVEASRRGWGADLLLFRGCGREMNRAPRFYHSGETGDLNLVARHLLQSDSKALFFFAGVSLGGNVLLKWLGELGEALPDRIIAGAAVSVPFDLSRASRHIDRGFSRVYQQHFLRTLRQKALAKLEQHPGLLTRDAVLATRTLWGFDDVVTAPMHGFVDAEDYYTRSSSIHFLHAIRIPTLLLSAVDDPFLPADVLDEARRLATPNNDVHVEFVEKGGHVGFVSGRNPLRPFYYAEWRVTEFFERARSAAYDRRAIALRSGDR